MIELNDFRYMQQGCVVDDLHPEDADLLKSQQLFKNPKKKRKALLMLHGFSSTPAVFRLMTPQIKPYDLIDIPALAGHAQSINSFSKVSATTWLENLNIHCQKLFDHYEQVDILGLSLGGLLACKLNHIFDFERTFLLAPALKLALPYSIPFYLRLAKIMRYLGFVEIRAFAGNISSDQHAEIAYRRQPLSTIIELLQLVQQHQSHALKGRVDLFLGAQDLVVDTHSIKQLFNDSPQVTTHWLEQSAHVLPLDYDVQQIIACINCVS